MGDGEKLLTHLNSALKVLLGLDIFPRVPKKKKLNFVDQCNQRHCVFMECDSFSVSVFLGISFLWWVYLLTPCSVLLWVLKDLSSFLCTLLGVFAKITKSD